MFSTIQREKNLSKEIVSFPITGNVTRGLKSGGRRIIEEFQVLNSKLDKTMWSLMSLPTRDIFDFMEEWLIDFEEFREVLHC